MVYRVYVEKKPALAAEAAALKSDAVNLLGITGLSSVRLVNRYDVEGIDSALFERCRSTVFAEPPVDTVSDTLDTAGASVFAVEYLPGQFDQRADSAAQCIQIIAQGERPLVRTARVYLLYGSLTEAQLEAIKHYVINPVEAREAALEKPETLRLRYDIPTTVETLTGFTALENDGLATLLAQYGLAMDLDDLRFCRDYFRSEKRDPTMTELRLIDTYWSDHCRHTTFLTRLDGVTFADKLLQKAYDDYLAVRAELGRTKPVTLMDLGTIAAKYLSAKGLLDKLDVSEEINACTVHLDVDVDGKKEPWLLLFKNETHNHPTEIEPFGGAATCIGGAIRDPLSGRAYVYAAMRVTGAADPLAPVEATLPGKLPQRKIVTSAAAGYSSYGNQIGLATGIVDELCHPGYAAKRMEIGAVLGAAPAANVRREEPTPGDIVILLGGRTGRDGCGGATGSSKKHTLQSLESCGAEVQKGNAPEERKLQRLFRNGEAARLIKRCNDFGAGGVSVAIGELADGLRIDLDAVPKKYDGLDGTELAISESQERMAVVVAPQDAERFLALAAAENLEATVVAAVTAAKRLTMDWQGNRIVDLSREFLGSNGAEKHTTAAAAPMQPYEKTITGSFADEYRKLAGSLSGCSRRGLSERFDSTIGAGTVLMPFGGRYQRTPIQAMVHKLPVLGETKTCSYMAWAYNPEIAVRSPYHAAYLAVTESVCKLIAAGADFSDVYLTFQEYFEKPGRDPKRWGQPLSALLGAFRAQLDLGVAAIGGKDSMSGSFEQLDVPPTLVSFAVTAGEVGEVLSPEFKAPGHRVALFAPDYDENGLPKPDSLKALFAKLTALMRAGKLCAAYTVSAGGIAGAVMQMAFGNGIGLRFADGFKVQELFGYRYGAFVAECSGDCAEGITLGETLSAPALVFGGETLPLDALAVLYEGKLEPVYPCNLPCNETCPPLALYQTEQRVSPAIKVAKPRVLIPVFPGTNCEYDSSRAVIRAGGEAEQIVIRNLTAADIADSVAYFAERLKRAQMIFLPGGFSAGDEPEGSGKFIAAFFRSAAVREGVTALLEQRDGLMLGVCNGFQALVKLGLLPYGRIGDVDESSPTLTFNVIGRHQSKLVRTRVVSNKSPWLMLAQPGEAYTAPVSHGEGRFLADSATLETLAKNGQIATQYVDLDGKPTMAVQFNPNGSALAVEGITSPDGRVFGKMAHFERVGDGLYKNVGGRFDLNLFESAMRYYR